MELVLCVLCTYRFFSNWLCVVRLVALTVGCREGEKKKTKSFWLVNDPSEEELVGMFLSK